jgi:hypothetical protein
MKRDFAPERVSSMGQPPLRTWPASTQPPVCASWAVRVSSLLVACPLTQMTDRSPTLRGPSPRVESYAQSATAGCFVWTYFASLCQPLIFVLLYIFFGVSLTGLVSISFTPAFRSFIFIRYHTSCAHNICVNYVCDIDSVGERLYIALHHSLDGNPF